VWAGNPNLPLTPSRNFTFLISEVGQNDKICDCSQSIVIAMKPQRLSPQKVKLNSVIAFYKPTQTQMTESKQKQQLFRTKFANI